LRVLRKPAGIIGALLVLNRPIAWLLDMCGLIDQVRPMLPKHWITEVLFLPEFGSSVTAGGVVLLVCHVAKQFADESTADEPTADAGSRPTAEFVALSTLELAAPFTDHRAADAQAITAKFIGKWIDVVVVVSAVTRHTRDVVVTASEAEDAPIVGFWFSGDDVARIAPIRVGDTVRFQGCLLRIDPGILQVSPAVLVDRRPRVQAPDESIS
jgi:hypothetical protein